MIRGTGSLEDFVQRIKGRSAFAFSRWGDGEWACVLGESGETCDGQRYSARLSRELTNVLRARPKYYLGMQRFAMKRMGPRIKQWLARHGLNFPWVNADVFASASRDGKLGPLLDALMTRDIVLVGPPYLEALPFPRLSHVPVDPHDCFADVRGTIASARVVIEQHEVPVVAVSAGPAAKIIVHKLQAFYPCAAVVDFGSLWEPYVGQANRKYHKKLTGRELLS